MEPRVLLLNKTFEPLRIISWQRAVCLWFDDKVEILETYDDFDLKSISITIKCPAVVRLLEYVNGKKHKVKFSRINIFGRDKYTCQYCGTQPGTSNLTYDHVMPRSRGGKTTWENIATCCYPCNTKKGDKTPKEANMHLLTIPVKPSWTPHNKLNITIPKSPEAWRNYLYWSQELEQDASGDSSV